MEVRVSDLGDEEIEGSRVPHGTSLSAREPLRLELLLLPTHERDKACDSGKEDVRIELVGRSCLPTLTVGLNANVSRAEEKGWKA